MADYDVIIIGGGPAGLAAAVQIYEQGTKNILIIEREPHLGGILQQCVHSGFGLHEFKQELTGPEYAQRFIDKVHELKIPYRLSSMVIELTKDREVHVINSINGYQVLTASAIVLAMGCRERTRGAISIPGTRPSGVITAGTAQYFLNIKGYLVGKKVFILGSGDIGLIMARRMTLEGAKVLGVSEILPYSGGLTRNIVQCLEDFNIPLYLSHTVVEIRGRNRINGITIAQVDEHRKPIRGTEKDFDVDTLLLSVGLIPDNELSQKAEVMLHEKTGGPIVNERMETNREGIFACGNVLHVHDLVDFVSAESKKTGNSVIKYLRGDIGSGNYIELVNGEGVSYIVPQKIRLGSEEDTFVEIFLRTTAIFKGCKLVFEADGEIIKELHKGHMAPAEMENIKLDYSLLASKTIKKLLIKVMKED